MGLPWGTCLTSHSYILHWNFNNNKKNPKPLLLFVFWRSLDFYATCLKNATRDDQSMRSAQALVPEAYSIIQRQCSKKSELTWNTYASPKVLVPTEADSEKTVKTGGFWRGFVICLLDFGPLTPGLLSVLNNFLLCVLFHSLAYSNSNSKSRVLLMMLKLVISFFPLSPSPVKSVLEQMDSLKVA